jgi:stress response protein YsnF
VKQINVSKSEEYDTVEAEEKICGDELGLDIQGGNIIDKTKVR